MVPRSDGDRRAAGSASHAWPARIDFAFVDRRLGPETVDRSLSDARDYLEPPRLDSASRLVARVGRGDHDASNGPSFRVAVRVRDDELELACSCPSQGRHLCGHAAGLLVDLAVDADLRERVARGLPTEEILPELPCKRRDALDERALDQNLARWLPPRDEDDVELDVDVVRSASAPHPDARPALLVFARRRPSRALVKPRELEAARLPAGQRRLVELAVASALHKDALVATRVQASLLLHMLATERTPHARLAPRLRFSKEIVAPRAVPHGERLVARWYTTDGRCLCDAADGLLFSGPFPYLYCEPTATFHPVAPEVDLDAAWGLSVVPSLPLTPELATRVGRALLGRGSDLGIVLPPPEVFGLPRVSEPSFVVRLSGSPLDVKAELLAVYGDRKPVVVPRQPPRIGDDGRDLEAERRATVVLEAAGLAGSDDAFGASEEGAVELWRAGIAKLRESERPRFSVEVAPSLERVAIGPPMSFRLHAREAAGWLHVELEFRPSHLKEEVARLHAALVANKRWIALRDGTLMRITDEIAALVQESSPWLEAGDRIRLPRHQFGRLERWLSRFGGDVDERVEAWRARASYVALRSEPQVPAGLSATLRPYQRGGLAWLQFLRELGVGGVLADDMGLGKTLVTLAFLLWCKETEGPLPSLVVCPTSVAFNWVREAARFAKDLRVFVALDARRVRETEERTNELDLLVVTYGVLRRHARTLSRTSFRCVIADEAQNVKNTGTRTAQAAKDLRASMRLALTGTPIENSLTELWSIMSFANPGMLGSEAEFEQRFERPMREGRGPAALEELRAVLRPFVLRRRKGEVLADLPPKTEILRDCILGARQRRLYEGLALAVKQAVKKDIEKRGFARSRLSVLTAILRLRQMACDPRLVDPSASAGDSAKRDAFLELVRSLASEGRRTLVFSQFVELFALWREDLHREGIAYEYLDGASTNREAIVDRFQRGAAPLFLVSLKAGGAGLNLTAADTVIHCDPWWNPAVLDQATDRAHRIGQQKAVTVVRLVAKDTIEEKMALLEGKKRDLASFVLDPEGAGGDAVPGLTAEDVWLLLGEPASVPAEARPSAEGRSLAEDRTPYLSSLEIDALRAKVRFLERTGLERKDIAKRAAIRRSHLSLLLIGHRVRISRAAADKIDALYDSRQGAARQGPLS